MSEKTPTSIQLDDETTEVFLNINDGDDIEYVETVIEETVEE